MSIEAGSGEAGRRDSGPSSTQGPAVPAAGGAPAPPPRAPPRAAGGAGAPGPGAGGGPGKGPKAEGPGVAVEGSTVDHPAPAAGAAGAGAASAAASEPGAGEAALGGAKLRSAVAPGGPIAAGSWVLLPAGDPGKKSKAKGRKKDKGARDPRFVSFVGRVERIVDGDDGGKWVDIRWLYKPGDIVDGVLPPKLRKRYSAKGTPRELLLSDHIDRNPLESVAGVTEVVHDSALADSAAARKGRAGPLFYRYIFLTKANPAKVVEDADGHLARRMFDGADLEAEGGGTSDDDDAMGFALEAHTAGKKKRKAERTPGSAGAAAKKKKPKPEKDAKDESARDPRAWYSDDDGAPERKSSFAKMDLLTNATDVARMDVDMDGGERRAQRDQILQLIEMSSATGLLRGDEANRLRLLHTLDHPGLAGLKDLLRAARETAGTLFNLSDLQNEPEVLQAMREALTIATNRAWHYVDGMFQPGTSAEGANPQVRLTNGSDRRVSNMVVEAHLTAAETPGHTDQLLVSVGIGGRTFRGWLAMAKAPAGVAIELERGK